MNDAQHTAPSSDGPGAATAAQGGPAHSPHDRHSAEYVRAWIAGYDERIASRQAQFDLLADLLPFAEDAPARILDLGAGWGPVILHLVQRFPAARVTLLDHLGWMRDAEFDGVDCFWRQERLALIGGFKS